MTEKEKKKKRKKVQKRIRQRESKDSVKFNSIQKLERKCERYNNKNERTLLYKLASSWSFFVSTYVTLLTLDNFCYFNLEQFIN